MSNSGAGAQTHEWHIPATPADTYDALRVSVEKLFKTKDADEFTRTVQFVTKMSATTYGAWCTAQVVSDQDESRLVVTIAARTGSNPAAAAKNAKNMQALLKSVSATLRMANV